MTFKLTEAMIRERASSQSFTRGIEYYDGGAIFDPEIQHTTNGLVLMGQCEGSSGDDYSLRITLDSGSIEQALCTCPYDWGGDCKHIVALLLTYLHQPETFEQRLSLEDLLAGLDREALVKLLKHLVENNPGLYSEVKRAVPAVPITPIEPTAEPGVAVIKLITTRVLEPAYRKRIKRIIQQGRYEEDGYDYDAYDEAPAYLEKLEEIQTEAELLLRQGDAEGALIILRILLDEMIDELDEVEDYSGDMEEFIEGVGSALTETFLDMELGETRRSELQAWIGEALETIGYEVDDYSSLELAAMALEHGWRDIPEPDRDQDEESEDQWTLWQDFHFVRLNVLDRQGRIDEFLKLAQWLSPRRYVLKLIELGHFEQALALSQNLEQDDDILAVAQRLYEKGYKDQALALTERRLRTGGEVLLNLAVWLAPIEEKRGQTDMALMAYRAIYQQQPSIEMYRKLKKLAGAAWQQLRQELNPRIDPYMSNSLNVAIHLEESEWDAAILLAENSSGGYDLLAKVAEKVIPHRPDWVIRVALKQSDDLIAPTQSSLYPSAAHWLRLAKQAYHQKGRDPEWQTYINNLRLTYARRPALQRALLGL